MENSMLQVLQLSILLTLILLKESKTTGHYMKTPIGKLSSMEDHKDTQIIQIQSITIRAQLMLTAKLKLWNNQKEIHAA